MMRKQLKTIRQRMSQITKLNRVRTLRSKTRLLSVVVCLVVLLTSVSTTFAWFGSSYENLDTVITMGKYSADISVYSVNGNLVENKTAENGDKISFDYINKMNGWAAGDVSAYYIYANNTGEIDIKAFLSFISAFSSSDINDDTDYTYAKKHFSYQVADVTNEAASNGGFLNFIENNHLPAAADIAKNGYSFADDNKGVVAGEIKAGENACFALYFCCYDIPETLLSDIYSFEFKTSIITTQAAAPISDDIKETTGDQTEVVSSTPPTTSPATVGTEPTEAVSTTAKPKQPVSNKPVWEWKYNNASRDSVTLTKYNGNDKKVVIPSIADGDLVTCLGDKLFEGTSVEKVVIPACITSFEKNAFVAEKLNSIEIQSKTSINNKIYTSAYTTDGKVIFTADNSALVKYMPYNMNASYTLPDSVTAIYENAFYGCKMLKVISMNNVDCVSSSTFAGSSITDYYLYSDKVIQSVGNKVFGSTKTTVLHTLKSMARDYKDAKSVMGYKVLSDIEVNIYENYPYTEIDGLKYVIMKNNSEYLGTKYTCEDNDFVIITGCSTIPADGLVIIPETIICDNKVYNVAAIAENAFKDCKKLKQVVLPSHKVTYAANSFDGCTNLGSIQYNSIIPYDAADGAEN